VKCPRRKDKSMSGQIRLIEKLIDSGMSLSISRRKWRWDAIAIKIRSYCYRPEYYRVNNN
jgi:hypothetical protein